MLQVHANNFLLVGGSLQACRIDVRVLSSPEEIATSEILLRLNDAVGLVESDCTDLQLEHTPAFVTQLRIRQKLGPLTFGELGVYANNLYTIYESELKNRLFVCVNSERKAYFCMPPYKELTAYIRKLSEIREIANRFPSCDQDVTDARNCYALEQDTACVMHLMRVLEVGLRSVAVEFNVSADRENWHNIIEQVEAKIRALSPTDGAEWRERQEFFAQACIEFMHFKIAWRNHAMHSRGRYNGPEARRILDHTMAFMAKLSERLSEVA